MKKGLQFLQSNLTSMTHNGMGMPLNCDLCGLHFCRPPSHVQRTNKHYCSVACANEGRKKRVNKECIICNAPFIVKFCDGVRIYTCSLTCKVVKSSLYPPNSKGINKK